MASCRETTDWGTTRRSVPAEAAAGSVGALSSGAGSIPTAVSMSRLSDLAASETTASSARSASSAGSRTAVFARIVAIPSRRLICSARWVWLLAALAPDSGVLLAHKQCDDLELRAHRGRHAAALDSCLHLADGAGEHRDDVLGVADASLLPRGGTASARLTPAWSSHRLLL